MNGGINVFRQPIYIGTQELCKSNSEINNFSKYPQYWKAVWVLQIPFNYIGIYEDHNLMQLFFDQIPELEKNESLLGDIAGFPNDIHAWGINFAGNATNNLIFVSNSLNGPWTFGRNWKVFDSRS